MIAIGTDIVRIARIADVVDRQGERFVSRILRPEERHEYRAHREPARLLAKRFAAKEAVAKCLGTGIGLSLIHISEPTRQESRSRMPSSA